MTFHINGIQKRCSAWIDGIQTASSAGWAINGSSGNYDTGNTRNLGIGCTFVNSYTVTNAYPFRFKVFRCVVTPPNVLFKDPGMLAWRFHNNPLIFVNEADQVGVI